MSDSIVADMFGTDQSIQNQAMTFDSGGTTYGITVDHCRFVEHDQQEGACVPVSSTRKLELIRFEGAPTPVFDACRLLGSASRFDEMLDLVDTLHARERDHVDWLESLEHSLRTGETFAEPTEPGQCAFGTWYESFRSDDLQLALILKQLDLPRRRLYGLAERLLEMREAGDGDHAMRVVEEERDTTLAEIRGLFADARAQIEKSIRRVVLIVETESRKIALRVDEITDLISFEPESLQDAPETHGDAMGGQLIRGFVTRDDGSMCVLLDCDALERFAMGGDA